MGHTVESDVPVDAVFTDTVYPLATTQNNGLMTKNDKTLVSTIPNLATKTHIIASKTTPSNQVENDIWLIISEW